MPKKKSSRRPRPLKDFDIVTHVVPVDSEKTFSHCDGTYTFQAIYLNKYGCKIGALVKDVANGEFHSWDPMIWDEYLWMKYEASQKTTDPRSECH